MLFSLSFAPEAESSKVGYPRSQVTEESSQHQKKNKKIRIYNYNPNAQLNALRSGLFILLSVFPQYHI